jgi:hypothetical protein
MTELLFETYAGACALATLTYVAWGVASRGADRPDEPPPPEVFPKTAWESDWSDQTAGDVVAIPRPRPFGQVARGGKNAAHDVALRRAAAN